MKVRVIDKPCLFAETVYLLYYYINGIAYTRDYERVNRKFGRYLLEKEDQGLQLAQELDRISAAVTQTLDPHQARLRYFFEKLPGTDEKTCCCLAHTMLVATPLNCTDIDSFAAELLRMFRYMSGIGFKINDSQACRCRHHGKGRSEGLCRCLQRQRLCRSRDDVGR